MDSTIGIINLEIPYDDNYGELTINGSEFIERVDEYFGPQISGQGEVSDVMCSMLWYIKHLHISLDAPSLSIEVPKYEEYYVGIVPGAIVCQYDGVEDRYGEILDILKIVVKDYLAIFGDFHMELDEEVAAMSSLTYIKRKKILNLPVSMGISTEVLKNACNDEIEIKFRESDNLFTNNLFGLLNITKGPDDYLALVKMNLNADTYPKIKMNIGLGNNHVTIECAYEIGQIYNMNNVDNLDKPYIKSMKNLNIFWDDLFKTQIKEEELSLIKRIQDI